MTEPEIHEMARLMGRGGCENRIIATAVAQAARTVAAALYTSPQRSREEQQRIVDAVRAEGWFE